MAVLSIDDQNCMPSNNGSTLVPAFFVQNKVEVWYIRKSGAMFLTIPQVQQRHSSSTSRPLKLA